MLGHGHHYGPSPTAANLLRHPHSRPAGCSSTWATGHIRTRAGLPPAHPDHHPRSVLSARRHIFSIRRAVRRLPPPYYVGRGGKLSGLASDDFRRFPTTYRKSIWRASSEPGQQHQTVAAVWPQADPRKSASVVPANATTPSGRIQAGAEQDRRPHRGRPPRRAGR